MSLDRLIAEEETHPDHCEEETGGTKDCLCRRDTRDLLREIQALNGDIQR